LKEHILVKNLESVEEKSAKVKARVEDIAGKFQKLEKSVQNSRKNQCTN
jgi:hypothetical protein